MSHVAQVLVALVALEHLWFLTLEMLLWQKPLGLKTFRMTPEQAAATATLAANQGLYNGFLAAGLAWALVGSPASHAIASFFLGCVVVAGVFGGVTASRSILFVQALPGAIALIVTLLS